VASLGPPRLAAMRWWSSRGVHASFRRDEEGKLLQDLHQTMETYGLIRK